MPELVKTPKMPKGIKKETKGKVKIAVSVDQDVFDKVIRNGLKRNLNFSESINDIAKCGILCLEEAEEL